MPYLAVDTTADLTAADRQDCTNALTELYTDIMETASDHVAIAVRDLPAEAMALGRAVDGPIAVLSADIRRGRPFDQRRRFGLAVVDWLHEGWEIPRRNLKVVVTEHDGNDLMGADRVGGEWSPDER
mgnify:FL=1